MIMRNRIKKHSLKLISVLISLLIWVYVLNSEKMQFEKVVSLDYILPEDRVFLSKPPQEVTFIIKGVRSFARTVSDSKDRVVIDLSRSPFARENMIEYELLHSQLKLPYGMKVERIIPKKLSLRLDKKELKTVPLKLRIGGDLPQDLLLHNPVLSPSKIEVFGPKSLLTNFDEIGTRPVLLPSLLGQNEISVDLSVPDERISLLTKDEVKLSYQIKAARSNFRLKDVPIRLITDKRKVSFDVKTANVSLYLSDKIIKNRLKISSSIEVWAEVPVGARGRVVIPLKAVLPPSMHLLEILPKTIIVNVE
jgi:YbbR domain-containing protein